MYHIANCHYGGHQKTAEEEETEEHLEIWFGERNVDDRRLQAWLETELDGDRWFVAYAPL